ncbi:hypothetical protein H2248_003176 [Termitomyces sp. 'cryptogamus']|nr:hypothetical protein H2248_003176 [Termitomyces sp. 'cryptogamus']
MAVETLVDYVASQDDLLQEAALALPHEFSKCTYSLGHIRQAVYLCLTCSVERGICSACSIACHTDHEQIELFPKRNFRCDCPTTSVVHTCILHKTLEEENVLNAYGPNFKAQFCRCGRPYDARTEQETMIQCLVCEDWFHESCCNLRERPTSRKISPEPHPEQAEVHEEGSDDDAQSQGSSHLPPGLISGTEYESFICGLCASRNKTLMRWAGTSGITMVVRDAPVEPWKRLVYESRTTENPDPITILDASTADGPTVGSKRPLSPSNVDYSDPKRLRGSSQAPVPSSVPCLAPEANFMAQNIYQQLDAPVTASLGTGDLFLSEGFRDRWCRCPSCLPPLEAMPCLLVEEETYEPPEDPDSGLSLEELGMRALERLPRDKAIDGIHAFNGMRLGSSPSFLP